MNADTRNKVVELVNDAVTKAQEGWRRVVREAVSMGVPVPGFSSALAYYDTVRRERLPANALIAA